MLLRHQRICRLELEFSAGRSAREVRQGRRDQLLDLGISDTWLAATNLSLIGNRHVGAMAMPPFAAQCQQVDTAAILVSVIDDDDSVRESLPDLLNEFGLSSAVFASASDFLQSAFIDKTTCLILDMAMPGISGPELRRELVKRGFDIPTIFITAHADFTLQPDLHDVECLLKPFSETALLDALKRAIDF